MADALTAAIADLPPGSKAPHIVSAIYGDDKLSGQGKTALAEMFMALYRTYTADGRIWLPPTETANDAR